MNDQIRAIFETVFKLTTEETQGLTEKHSIHNVSNWDSLGHIRLILALEKGCGVSIPDEKAIELISIEKIEKFITQNKTVAQKT